ncbi:hypothetical protein UlMin_002242 [Ulmus minor]
MYNDTAYELWKELKERFSHTNSVHLFQIEQEIHDCIQGGTSIGEYYTKLKSLWDTRDALCPLPHCGGNAAKELQEYQQKQRTIKFLMGLNGIYTAARGQILLMEPLPAVNKVYSLIVQDEKQRAVSSQTTGKMPEATAFAARDNRPQYSHKNHAPRNSHLKCDRCDRVGHISDNCRSHLKCDFCGFTGHTINVCRKRKAIQDKKNAGYGSSSKAHHADSPASSPSTMTPSYNLTTNARGRRLGWELRELDVPLHQISFQPTLTFGINVLVIYPIKVCMHFPFLPITYLFVPLMIVLSVL